MKKSGKSSNRRLRRTEIEFTIKWNGRKKILEDDLTNLHFTVGMWIRNNFVYPRNEKLLHSCREVSGDQYLHWAQVHMVIIRELYKRLQEAQKLKVLK